MTERAGDGIPAVDSTAFGRTTAVRPLGDGRYACSFDAAWSVPVGINGGILMAVLVRAIHAEVGPGRQLRSLTCQFMRPPKATEATVVVEVVRTGKRATNLRVTLEQDGRPMVIGLAICFTGGLREVATWSPGLPQVPPPAEVEIVSTLDPRMPSIADRLIYRPCIGPAPYSGTALAPGQPARTGGWLDLTEPHPVETALLVFFLDAWWPAALGPIDTLSMNPTIDFTFHQRTELPPQGLPPQSLLLDVWTVASQEGLCDEDAAIYTADGTLLAQARQLAITLTPEDRPLATQASLEQR